MVFCRFFLVCLLGFFFLFVFFAFLIPQKITIDPMMRIRVSGITINVCLIYLSKETNENEKYNVKTKVTNKTGWIRLETPEIYLQCRKLQFYEKQTQTVKMVDVKEGSIFKSYYCFENIKQMQSFYDTLCR